MYIGKSEKIENSNIHLNYTVLCYVGVVHRYMLEWGIFKF